MVLLKDQLISWNENKRTNSGHLIDLYFKSFRRNSSKYKKAVMDGWMDGDASESSIEIMRYNQIMQCICISSTSGPLFCAASSNCCSPQSSSERSISCMKYEFILRLAATHRSRNGL